MFNWFAEDQLYDDDIVYAHGSISALEVMRQLPEAPTKTAVRTHLRILEEKGHLTHSQTGQTYFYRPTRPRTKAGKSALKRVLQTFFENSLEQAVAAHLADRTSPIDEAELERISQLIEKARSTEE